MTSRRNVTYVYVVALAVALAFESRAAAQQASEETADPLALQVHGFVSPGFIVSTNNNYLSESKRGSFEFAEVGINFTKPITDDLRVGVQLFARDLGRTGNYNAKFDWFYLDYHFRDWLGLRAGRVKIPFGLYNEINDIDAARVPILLPQSVYPVNSRDFLLAQTGGELYGRLQLNRAGVLDYRAYGGTIFVQADIAPGAPYAISRLTVPYLVGGRVLWETPVEGLRAGGSVQYLHLDADVQFNAAAWTPLVMSGDLPMDFTGLVKTTIPALLWVGSVEYARDALLIAAEYSRWHTKIESDTPSLFPGPTVSTSATSERAYVMGSYRVASWIVPGMYYSLYFPDVRQRTGRAARQHDVAATLRFDVNDHWLVKLEGHFMHGTAALESRINENKQLAQLADNWWVFMVKTTAYF
jgi:hypothetical protein